MSQSHNHKGRFRPVLGGIKIRCVRGVGNAQRGNTGSIATIVTHNASGMACLLSNFHVLCGGAGDHVVGDIVHQPHEFDPNGVVARLLDWDQALDAAIATLTVPGTQTKQVLGIGPLAGKTPPVVGDRVIKAGVGTGVSEGVIDSVNGSIVTIAIPPGFPEDYELSKLGDSGSLWVTRDGRQPVALHRAGEVAGQAEVAVAVELGAVEAALGVTL